MSSRPCLAASIPLAAALVLAPAAARAQNTPPPSAASLVAAANRIAEQSPPAPAAGSARDSVLNGMLIGAAIGGALGLIPDHFDDCEECHDSLYASIAVGAGIGLVVDVLRNRGPIAVGITRTRHGVGVWSSIRWR